MKVLYHIPYISKKSGGLYQYAIALLKILARAEMHDLYVYSLSDEAGVVAELARLEKEYKRVKVIGFHEPGRAKFKRRLKKIYNKVGGIFRLPAAHMPPIEQYLVDLYGIEVVHTPYQGILKLEGVPTMSTMHDVQELYFPEFFSSKERADRAVNFKHIIDSSDLVIVSYNHVKKDIIRFFEKPEDKVRVCLIDMQDLWLDQFSEKDILSKEELGIKAPFILYPAATWPHKNHLGLIRALAKLHKNGQSIDLVCTGHQKGHYELVKEEIRNLGLETKVHFMGLVSDQQLYSLYHHTQATVVPTLYEAGSFPLMESLLMGIPVICAATTSLPETIGDSDFVFNPKDIDEMASKIAAICWDEAYRKRNLENGKIQGQKLRDNQTAQKMSAWYNNLCYK